MMIRASENLLTVMSSLEDHNERAAVTGHEIDAKAKRSASSGYYWSRLTDRGTQGSQGRAKHR